MALESPGLVAVQVARQDITDNKYMFSERETCCPVIDRGHPHFIVR